MDETQSTPVTTQIVGVEPAWEAWRNSLSRSKQQSHYE